MEEREDMVPVLKGSRSSAWKGATYQKDDNSEAQRGKMSFLRLHSQWNRIIQVKSRCPEPELRRWPLQQPFTTPVLTHEQCCARFECFCAAKLCPRAQGFLHGARGTCPSSVPLTAAHQLIDSVCCGPYAVSPTATPRWPLALELR